VTDRAEAPAPGLPVTIDYGRLGGTTVIYRQRLVHAGPRAIVTLQEDTPIARPKRIDGVVILEPGSPVVWFTFEGAWHDIGAFHRVDGTFTGWYANVLTPVDLPSPAGGEWRWSTTDLCLDVWSDGDAVRVLDEDELETVVRAGAVDPDLATRAREEAARISRAARNDEWPPAVVGEWPLERARAELRRAGRA
jgi:predicted RNA-binding protein associated with RNAse of E/G family